MRTFLLTISCLAVALAVLGVGAGQAAPHGANGQISYDRHDPASPDDTFVYVADPNGSHERQLVPSHGCCAGWSPDGTRLAVPRLTDDGRIGTAVVSADGSASTALPIDDPTLNVGCGTGSWSPDGRLLACESWDDANAGRNGIYTVSAADGSALTRVTSNPLGGHDIPADYSPDGRRIVFVRTDQDGNQAGLFTVRTDGRGLRQLAAAGPLVNIGGDWSPRGNEIVFSRHVTGDARSSLWMIHPNGSGLREIRINGLACGGLLSDPTSIGCLAPRWSPDGKRLVFAVNSATGSNVYTANADGRFPAPVTHGGADSDPDWGTHPLSGEPDDD